MNYQSAARNQRTKGINAKNALQFAMLLALCIWLLYQFKNSHENIKGNHVKILIKISEEHGAKSLGRKGNAAWYSSEVDSNSKDVHSTEEKSDQEESYRRENEYNRESITRDEEKQDQKASKTQNEESKSYEDLNHEEFSSNGHENVEKNSRDNEETDLNEPRKFEEDHTWPLIPHKDEAYNKNTEGKDHIGEIDNHELQDGVHSFHDENGIPEDVDNIVESTASESIADKNKDLLQESNIRTTDSMLQGGEEQNGVANTESKIPVEDLKIDGEAEAKIDPRASLQNDLSSIKHTPEDDLERSIL